MAILRIDICTQCVYNKVTIKERETPKGDHKMNTKLYLDFIKNTLATEGIKIADTANKLALEAKRITVEQYSAAARIIVEAYLAQ